jgi:hypothetical protein
MDTLLPAPVDANIDGVTHVAHAFTSVVSFNGWFRFRFAILIHNRIVVWPHRHLERGSGTEEILGKPVMMPSGDLYPSIDYWMPH